MPEVTIAGFAGRTSFTGSFPLRSYANLITPRAAADGSFPLMIVDLYGAVAGNGGTRSVTMYLGSSNVSFSVGSASSAGDTGWQDSGDILFSGGEAIEYGYTASGSIRFARSSTAAPTGSTGDVYDGSGYRWPGSLSMIYRYWESPSAPGFSSVVANDDGDVLTITTSAPSDSGGAAVSGYRIQRARNSGFSTGLSTVDSAGSTIMTGLTPGQTYYLRVTARNTVTNTASKLGGPWSSTYTITMPDPAGAGRIYSGGSFVSAAVRRWNGSSWADAEGRRYNGSTWQDLGD
jgi:hypothetical protein